MGKKPRPAKGLQPPILIMPSSALRCKCYPEDKGGIAAKIAIPPFFREIGGSERRCGRREKGLPTGLLRTSNRKAGLAVPPSGRGERRPRKRERGKERRAALAPGGSAASTGGSERGKNRLPVGRIAQLVEQLTLNQRVQGSSPCAPTTILHSAVQTRPSRAQASSPGGRPTRKRPGISGKRRTQRPWRAKRAAPPAPAAKRKSAVPPSSS